MGKRYIDEQKMLNANECQDGSVLETTKGYKNEYT